MAKNPKIEFFKIILNSTKSDKDITFRELFTEIYEEKNPSKKDEIKDDDLMRIFLERIFDKIDGKFEINNNKKKAFYVRKQKEKLNEDVKLNSTGFYIHGLVKGGAYDTGKEEGSISDPLGENKRLSKAAILLDNFYFLLYTPLDKNIGILILQNYTSDQIADIFLPFVKVLFKVNKLSYNASLREFMPKEMQENFKENSSVKKFVFSNQYLISEMDEGVKSTGNFTINITVSASDKDVKVENLPFWKKIMKKIKIDVPGNDPRLVESFNRQIAYIKDDSSKSNPTKFDLDDDLLKIKATIYLENYIKLEENRVPVWKELEKFAVEMLTDVVIPEVYIEDNIDEE